MSYKQFRCSSRVKHIEKHNREGDLRSIGMDRFVGVNALALFLSGNHLISHSKSNWIAITD